MTILRLCVCLLVSATLFILGGCHKTVVRAPVCDVKINACAATPDEVKVKEGGQLCWQVDDKHDYTIGFLDSSEPTAPFKIKHGASSPGHVIRGHRACKPIPGYPGEFYCKYTVIGIATSNDSTSCTNDPGVHIIPGG